MKRLTYFLILFLFFLPEVNAQDDYTNFMSLGKYYFNNGKYISALQQFDLAFENAGSETRKNDAKTWKTNSFKSLRELQGNMKKQLELNEKALKYSKNMLDMFYFYDDKIALAFKDGKYGFVHKSGKMVIPFIYDKASPFEESNGFATAWREGKSYLLDTTGREFLLASNSESLNGNVEALDLRNQHLSKLPDYVFDYVGLKILLLSNNELSSLPESIVRLKEITHLDASFNKIQELPERMSEFLKLEHLSLQNNFINRLPDDIVFVKNLKSLDLTNNKLYSLPNNMGSMYYLSVLKLDGNKIESLPADIGYLRNLRLLSLRNNSLKTIPPGIATLYHLQTLRLDQNDITDLPQEISRLPELKELHLSRNKIGNLPIEIKQLAGLEKLKLQGNPIPQSKKELIEGWLPDCAVLF